MRPTNALLVVLSFFLAIGAGRAQPPADGKRKADPPSDEYKVLLSVVTEAYKAPHEVDKDVLDELRKQYRDPSPKREEKILREVRRLYATTPEHEEAIVRELRATYASPTPDGEARVFAVIGRNGRLPPGTIPNEELTIRATKLFARFDQDKSKTLGPDEMPETLRADARRWDRNGDGGIDADEYAGYYREQLSQVSAKVASGEIALKLPKGMTMPTPEAVPTATVAMPGEDPRAVAARYGKLPPGLPDWFVLLDEDQDGQIGLYEWRKAKRPTAEFVAMDLNGDGLLPADEYLRYARTADPPVTAAKPVEKGGRPMRGM
jgi:hypothetical protein